MAEAPRFLVPVTFLGSELFDALYDDPTGGAEAIVGVLALLTRLKERERDSERPGEFGSERALREALGERARFINLYRRVGILDGLRCAVWRWQRAADTRPHSSKRNRPMGLPRERRRDSGLGLPWVNPNPNPNPTVNPEGGADAPPGGARATFERRTHRRASDGASEMLARLIENHGDDAVATWLGRIPVEPRATYLSRTETQLMRSAERASNQHQVGVGASSGQPGGPTHG